MSQQSQYYHIIQSVNQFMMANGCVLEKDINNLLVNIKYYTNPSDISEERTSKVISKINKKLDRFNMMIRLCMDDIIKERFYVLISKTDNEITHAAHHHTPKEFEYFKLILTDIVNDPRGIIPENKIEELANKAAIPTKGKRGSLSEHKVLFNEWCRKHWLIIVIEGGQQFITLGVRSIAELDVFIRNKLVENGEDLNCKNCHNMSIYSVTCNNCGARYHKRCAKMSIDPDSGLCKSCMNPVPSTSAGPSSKTRKIMSK